MRRRAAPVALGLGTLAVVAIAATSLSGGGEGRNARATSAGGATATIERRTLVARETVDGTLGYAGGRTVINRLAAAGGGSEDGGSAGRPTQPDDQSEPDDAEPTYEGSGTVTALPRSGSIVRRGEPLYRLDEDPIVLMYGSTPAYRALRAGVSDGPDVLELESNLAALGFDPGTIDEGFTSATAAAVRDWQESLGLEETGAVELGRVVFLPGARRIGQHRTAVGSVLGAGAEVLDTSSPERVVTVELEAGLQELARGGERVEVTMPDGSLARGRITRVGRVARELEGSAADPTAEAQLVVDVTIELRSTRGSGRLDEAPVSVGLAQEVRRAVLAAPVGALVARRGGGFGVELASTRRVVPVEAGLFADGYVEISGGALRAGTRVVVPSE